MNYLELFIDSMITLTLNKMRTGLAILGIIIGIGSVIALMSLGHASQKAIQSQIQSLGSNLLTVMPSFTREGNVRSPMGGSTTLTNEDAEAIRNSKLLATVKTVSPEYSSRTQVTTGGSNTNTQIIGVVPSYAEVHKTDIATGSFINQKDVDGISKVAVLGPQAAADLFGEGPNAVGQTIRIKTLTFTVIGVTAAKGGTGFQNQDDVIYIPLSTAQKQLFGVNYLSSIAIEAVNPEVMTDAQNEVGYFLLQRHKISDPESADFSIFSQQDILNTVNSTTGTFTALLSGIAAISLLVGGIGIMNIMLVTVTERTREIGLRKALGAKNKIIIVQFLFESIVLTVTGGVIGVGIGIGISVIITRLINVPFSLAIESIFLAFIVSGVIGVVFGWYPARRAANLEPIEALRYE